MAAAGVGGDRGRVAGAALGAIREATPVASGEAEILWDAWGVPHVFAADADGLFFGFGWAQARNHGDLLLRLYAHARGRAAEVYGEIALENDRAVRTMGLHRRGIAWYEDQSHTFRGHLDAFAAGINAYAAAHPETLDPLAREVLPVSGSDVLAHVARTLFLFLGPAAGIPLSPGYVGPLGSNGWAVAPFHTAAGHALLLANPHLGWVGDVAMFEAHLVAPGAYTAYGTTFVGYPVLAIAFNDRLGWTHTVNTIDPGDLYALTLDGDGYRFDGEVRAFERRTETILIREADGGTREERLEVRRSVHGPVIDADGTTLAARLAALDDWSSAAGALEQWWDMGRAQDLAAFEAALRRLQVPMFTVLYADRDGHVLSLFNGQVPRRPSGDWAFWQGPVPGDTSATLWTEILAYDELPRVVDPPGGWVQNCNSAPWFTTYPLQLDPAAFPPYLAPPDFLGWRERRSIRMLEENPDLTLDRLAVLKYSTRMELADRLLDELIASAGAADDPQARRAAAVLAAWDREANPDSRGALLFFAWVQTLGAADPVSLSDLFANPADLAEPLTTPSGLRDPERAVRALVEAAAMVEDAAGRLDPPWGEVARLRIGGFDLPANGFPGDPYGAFRVLYFAFGGTFFDVSTLAETGTTPAIQGDTYVAAIEFADPVRALVLNTYGNASQPGSPHRGDQLALSARGEMRPAWLTRREIEANLAERELVRQTP
jgi:acyl-homoserine-lactone acylase